MERHCAGFETGSVSGPGARPSDCLSRLARHLEERGLDPGCVLRLTCFLNSNDPDGFRALRRKLENAFRRFFGPQPPPAAFVGQPPADGHPFAVEAWILSRRGAGEKILDRTAGGTAYRVVEGPGGREIHAAVSGAASARGARRQAESAFHRLSAILSAENLAFSDIVRQWNYIEGIVDKRSEEGILRQNYQVFNDVRTAFYASADFRRGYPAATGIGMNRGGVVIEGLAQTPGRSRLRILPLSNPLQQDAHRYSQEVLAGRALSGMERKGTPKFERAKLVAEGDRGIIFISGTAAIRGQATVLENPGGQARTTLDNIEALISRSNLEAHGWPARRPGRIEYLRVYVKRPEDAQPVREVVRERLPDVPALYVISDVCRPELLVEIEGIARLDPD